MRVDLIVPFAMKLKWFLFDRPHFGIRHFSAGTVVVFVKPAMHLQPLVGMDRIDEVHRNHVRFQRDSTPVACDIAEQSMLGFVPFG